MSEPPALRDEDRVAFHVAEFNALKAEMGEHAKATTANLQYALLASAGIFSWLLKEHPLQGVASVSRIALWLPFLVSNVFGLYAILLRLRLGKETEYVRKVEAMFALDGLGWERYVQGRLALQTWLQSAAWTALIVGDAVLAIVMT